MTAAASRPVNGGQAAPGLGRQWRGPRGAWRAESGAVGKGRVWMRAEAAAAQRAVAEALVRLFCEVRGDSMSTSGKNLGLRYEFVYSLVRPVCSSVNR
jgi:hypothetical protein